MAAGTPQDDGLLVPRSVCLVAPGISFRLGQSLDCEISASFRLARTLVASSFRKVAEIAESLNAMSDIRKILNQPARSFRHTEQRELA